MNHEKHLKALLKKISIETPNNQKFSRRFYINIFPDVEEHSKVHSLVLLDKEIDIYHNSLEKLRKDSQTEYLKDNELKNKLDILILEVWQNETERRNENFLVNKIKEFLEKICKPLEEYEIIFKIDNLKIKRETIFWDFIISNLTKEELIEKGFDESENGGIYKISDFENKTLIFVKEVGNNNSLIVKRARKRANFAVKLLQSYLSEMYFVRNEQLLFSLSTDYTIRKISNKKALGGWHRDFSPLVFDYEDAFAKFTNKANEDYELIISLTPDIKNAIERAYYWVGKSISEFDFDIKIALLFSALESILTTINDGMKGQRIAYRIALLNTSFDTSYTHPSDILEMYKMRSDIIHGSKIDVTSTNEYNKLLLIVREVLSFYIKFSKINSVKKPLDIINLLIKSDESKALHKWLINFSDKNSQEVAKYLLEDIEKDRNKT